MRAKNKAQFSLFDSRRRFVDFLKNFLTMASVAPLKLNTFSSSSYNCLRCSNFSDNFSIRLKFDTRPLCPRPISVCAHDPDLGGRTVSGFVPKYERSAHLQALSSPSATIDFLTLCHNLKSTKRKGWVNHGIEGSESISDHMYRMALMALIADDLPGVNRERCIKIAIVHDIAEAIVGDITPSDGVPKEEKSRMEREALDEMCRVLGGGMRAEEIRELWEEYENNSTLEANLVKDFDKVELILQALEYETEHGKELDEFFQSVKGKIQTEVGLKWAAEITSRRRFRSANSPN